MYRINNSSTFTLFFSDWLSCLYWDQCLQQKGRWNGPLMIFVLDFITLFKLEMLSIQTLITRVEHFISNSELSMTQ